MFTVERIKSLKGLEIEVYKYIINNPSKVEKMTIRELAESSHVSATMILRFCEKMGCEGFSDFKTKLKLTHQSFFNLMEDDKLSYIFKCLKNTREEKEMHKINDVANSITKAKKVIFCGAGSSGILARYGARILTDFGKMGHYANDLHSSIPQENHVGTVILPISVTGETDSVIRQVIRFKELGATIISISSNELSTLSKISDIALHYHIPIENSFPFQLPRVNVTSQVPCLYILESIARSVSLIIDENKNGK